MRILLASTVFAFACGGPQPKGESALVNAPEQAPTCCCKTMPTTAEKELVPNYSMMDRMECSGAQGECVDDVQCNAQEGTSSEAPSSGLDGVPPPAEIEPDSSITP